MEMLGICSICGRPGRRSCIICGRIVCERHHDQSSGLCDQCRLKAEGQERSLRKGDD